MKLDGCTKEQIDELESRFGVRFPTPYRRFLSQFGCNSEASPVLIGSDYTLPRLLDLRSGAETLLQESGALFTLHPQDFVLLMHQGYQFFFFRADGGSDDPPVYYYFEGRAQPERKFDSITGWLKKHQLFVV